MALAPLPSLAALLAFVGLLAWLYRHRDPAELCRWCGRSAGRPPHTTHVHWVHDPSSGEACGAHVWHFCSDRCLQLTLIHDPEGAQP